MKSWEILYSKWKNDEMYTPVYWVLPIIKYIPKYRKVRASIIDPSKLGNSKSYYNGLYRDLPILNIWEKSICVDLWVGHDVVPIENVKIDYIPNIIRCPFDTKDSNFVKELEKAWYEVISSHISEWKDFYEYEPEKRDIIVSNPPFTWKRKIFERCLSFNKPFALLMTNIWLNDSAPKQLFKEKELQLLMFDKRIEYSEEKKITFSSSYYCYKILPQQIIMHYLHK